MPARRPEAQDRHADPASTTRTSSAPTGSSTRSPRTRTVKGACVAVDFGTATNFDVVSGAGEYLGGVIGPGVEISLEALTARAAKLPQDRPRRARGRDRQAHAGARSSRGFVYGFAGLVDGIDRRLREELGEEADASSPPAAWPRTIAPHCETIDEVDELLTLTRPAADPRAQHLAWSVQPPAHSPVPDRRRRDRQPRPARAAGRDRQLVRAPAGAATRRRPGRLGDGLELRAPLPQRAHAARAASASTPTSTRSRSSSSARTPR